MSKNEIYLYVGCGNHRIKKFLHVDVCAFKQFKGNQNVGPPDLICDISINIPLKDSSCKIIYSRETLEHLKYSELVNHFIECNRLLQSDGVIRMVVPDFDLFIKDYLNKVFGNQLGDPKSLAGPLENYVDFFVNRILYPDHFYLHNINTLSRILKRCGFIDIKTCLPGQTEIKDLTEIIYNCEKGRESSNIIIEAKKNCQLNLVKEKRINNLSIFNKVFAYMFNIILTRYNNKRAKIFEYMWFYEKFLIIRQKLFFKKILKNYLLKKNTYIK
jgi:predicted SAM-dependent methyltransferase